MEALLTSCNAIEDPEEHAALVGGLLEPYAQRLAQGDLSEVSVATGSNGPLYCCRLASPREATTMTTRTDQRCACAPQAVSSPENLVQFGGLTEVCGEQDVRLSLTDALTTLTVALRVTKPRGEEPDVKMTQSGLGGTTGGGDGMFHPCEQQARTAFLPVLQLVRSIQSLWDPSFQAMAGDFQVLLGMRRSDVSALLTGVVSGISREMTVEELWVDRSQLWLSNLRVSCYEMFDFCVRQGWPFEMPNFAETLMETVLYGLENMELWHLRMVLRHVIVPLAKYGPREHPALAQLEGPFAAFYGTLGQVLHGLWEEASVGVAENAIGRTRGSASMDMLEIVSNKLLKDLTTDLVSHLGLVLGDTTAITSQESTPSRAGMPVVLGPMGSFLLVESAASDAVLKILCGALAWPSSRSAMFAAECLANVTLIMSNAGAMDLLCGQVLPAAIRGLEVNGQHGDCQSSMLSLVA